jgi:hypothetical protein
MNKILEKRESLERFIREQTLGPGINGYRFVDLEDEMILKKNLYLSVPLEYENEILDIVPAAIYSTGILFPKDASGTSADGAILDNNETSSEGNDGEEEDSQNSSRDDVEALDTVELNQMFPRTMGFTCCLDEECLNAPSIEVKVKARYYKKLKHGKNTNFNEKYGLLCEVPIERIQDFLIRFQISAFKLKTISSNTILTLSKLGTDEITILNKRIWDVQKQIAEQLYDRAIAVTSMPQLTRSSCYLSSLKSTLFFELKSSVVDESVRLQLYELTQEIELVENIADHLRNLLDINSGGYGLWQSEIIKKTIRIENVDFKKPQKKKIFFYKTPNYTERIVVVDESCAESDSLEHIFRFDLDDKKSEYASLSANIQLSRDSRKENNKVFLKVQLINTSSPFKKAKPDDNRYYSTFNELVNQKSFFGIKLSLSSQYLVPYNNYSYTSRDGNFDEDTTTRFIYDQFKDYGIGHGCSVKWNASRKEVETEYIPYCDTPDVDPIPRNKSKMPISDGKDFKDPLFLSNTKAQEFKWLSSFSNATDEDVITGLNDFVDAYGQWIKLKQKQYETSCFKDIASQELQRCQEDYRRMKDNINTFFINAANKKNLESFRLMNATMFMQLWHSEKVKKGQVLEMFDDTSFTTFDFDFYKTKADSRLFSPTESASWRAFQLAFILLNLDGIFRVAGDSLWTKRNNWVDLVWFPTGGGKTEAYLGLIALTIIDRRRNSGIRGGGTAAIMRYTLRLLTMQQFQRATLVIMALELMRRWGTYELDEEPITIGLWVGKNSIPNSNIDLIKEYEEKLNDKKENRIPFSFCPWCGSEIRGETKEDLEPTTNIFNKHRVHLKCGSPKCSFSFGLGRISRKRKDQGPIPVCLSDEIIYLHPPSLLFGTVDKFAQLAHKVSDADTGRKSDSRRIFGKGNWENGKPNNGYLPPDLIIQDELHLLLGPLGSAVALFESAIDQLCTREDGTRPKIISSTATTRNTQLQIAALFDREVNLFPKPGVECDDSFFAFYKRTYQNQNKEGKQYLSHRKYMGILPTGRTQIWMQMRLAAIILTHRALFELKELGDKSPIDFDSYGPDVIKVMDYYHTVISYFNSLKEVGKTQSQVQTYILKEFRRVYSRVIRPQKLMGPLNAYKDRIIEAELTGRLSGEEVKNEMRSVESRWQPLSRFAHVVGGETLRGKIPPEFVVATNMISVGIDVSRFNTIIVNSMPRNIAEYIQASSRVARESYGLVLTVHHPFRARDISHYEKFIEFHEKMYSYVEPISITPFTQKAVDRYMGLYLATIIRHRTEFVNRDSAGMISQLSDGELKQFLSNVMEYFQNRKLRMEKFDSIISNLLKDENVSQIRTWLKEALDEWKDESNKTISENKTFVFNNKALKANPPQEQLYVDIDEYEGNIHSKKWQVPMSLRVIEPEAAIKINSQ